MDKKDYVPGTDIEIFQRDDRFKYTTDSLILSSFANVKGKVLDAGCGNGILSLRVLNRAREVVSVDMEEIYTDNLNRTIELNNLKNIKVVNSKIENLEGYSGYFDTIITNPPYFTDRTAMEVSEGRERHTEDIHTFIKALSKYLKYGGRMYMVFPSLRLQEIAVYLKELNLYIKRIKFIKKDISSKSNIMLLDIRLGGGYNLEVLPDFYMYEDGEMTEEFKAVYRNEVMK